MKSYWTKSALAFTSHYYQQCCASLHKDYSIVLNILCLVSTPIYYHSFTATTCITSVGFKIVFTLYFKLSEQLLQMFLSPRKVT